MRGATGQCCSSLQQSWRMAMLYWGRVYWLAFRETWRVSTGGLAALCFAIPSGLVTMGVNYAVGRPDDWFATIAGGIAAVLGFCSVYVFKTYSIPARWDEQQTKRIDALTPQHAFGVMPARFSLGKATGAIDDHLTTVMVYLENTGSTTVRSAGLQVTTVSNGQDVIQTHPVTLARAQTEATEVDLHPNKIEPFVVWQLSPAGDRRTASLAHVSIGQEVTVPANRPYFVRFQPTGEDQNVPPQQMQFFLTESDDSLGIAYTSPPTMEIINRPWRRLFGPFLRVARTIFQNMKETISHMKPKRDAANGKSDNRGSSDT